MALSIDPDFADAQTNLAILEEVLREVQQSRGSN
jgi:hypothetical protein